jgi:dTDP-4-dehydrorhamnose reductase
MTRLLITGASGLLGLNLALTAYSLGYDVIGWANDSFMLHAQFPVLQVNLLDKDQIRDRILRINPSLIIHCAALASLEGSEADPELAKRLNAEVPGEIARVAFEHDIKMIHISTDAVFDGKRGGYTEADTPSPLNVYAQTKLEGEYAVSSANKDAIIARVNFYGWSLSGKRSLVEFFFNNLSQNIKVNGFKDVFFCPLYTRQLGLTLLEMAGKDLKGLYHVLSSEALSKYDFGLKIARKFGFDDQLVNPILLSESGLTATRSPNMTLSVEKLQRDLGCTMPGQDECLDSLYKDYLAGLPGQIKACL